MYLLGAATVMFTTYLMALGTLLRPLRTNGANN